METSGRYEHLLLLGSTGRVGKQLLAQALQRGYRVTALVRDPARLPTNDHSSLRVVQGALEDTALLAEILESGVDAVLSTLGVYLKKPATTLTDMTAPVIHDMPDMYQSIVARTPAGRFGEPEECAGTAVFLAGPASDFVTGQSVAVCGGYSVS